MWTLPEQDTEPAFLACNGELRCRDELLRHTKFRFGLLQLELRCIACLGAALRNFKRVLTRDHSFAQDGETGIQCSMRSPWQFTLRIDKTARVFCLSHESKFRRCDRRFNGQSVAALTGHVRFRQARTDRIHGY